MKTKYKLVDKDGYTRRGESGETYWLDRVEKIATGAGRGLCSSGIIHYYDHPLLAVLFNPIHANISAARLIEIEIDAEIAHDGLKGGCKKAKYVKEIELPMCTIEQRTTFAIKISLKYYKDENYRKWAENWLNGKDKAESAAWSAAYAARSAAPAAYAARSAASAAAAYAARSAESAAAASAESAASAARSAAWSTAYAESAAKINKLFIKTFEEIVCANSKS